jgi:hypothetical protein
VNELGLMTRFRTLQQISHPGSPTHPNEDGQGFLGRFAWVVDGATGVSGARLTPGTSDAAWLSGLIGEKLRADAGWLTSPGAVFRDLEAALESAFSGLVSSASLEDDHIAPSACLGLLHIEDAAEGCLTVKGAFLGDVVALVPTRSGVVRWTDERAKPFERMTLASLQTASGGGTGIPEKTRMQILENRTKLNRPDGYWVVHPVRPWAGHELVFEAEIEAGRPVALATDGFMRLVDVFGSYSDEALYAALAAGGAEDLMRELREFEAEEGSLESCPRVKVHDDATVVVLVGDAGQ